jgi:hypothetical protein
MKSKKLAIAAGILGFACASLLSLERDPHGRGAMRFGSEAHALFLGKVWNGIKKGVSGAVKTVGNVVKKGAEAVGNVVKKGAEAVGKAAKDVGGAIVKGVQGVAELAKKGVEAVGEAVKKGLLALKDLLSWVWNTMKDKLLHPVGDFFKNMIEKAKQAVQALVDKAKQALEGIFNGQVIIPALVWAFENIFPGGKEMLAKLRNFVERILGKAEALTARGNEFTEVVQALADRNLERYQAAMSKFEAGLTQWTNINLEQLAGQLVEYAKDRILEFVRSKTVDLLEKAYSLVERPIELGKTAALSAISTIPFVGGVLSGAADVVITLGLKMLRDLGFKFVADKVAELAGKAVDAVGGYLVRGAAALDSKLQPILAKIRPFLNQALEVANGVKTKWFTLRDKLKQAGELLAKARGAVQ